MPLSETETWNFLYEENLENRWIKQLCDHKVWDFAMVVPKCENYSGLFEKRARGSGRFKARLREFWFHQKKIQAVKTILWKIYMLRLTFNPGLELTGFWTTLSLNICLQHRLIYSLRVNRHFVEKPNTTPARRPLLGALFQSSSSHPIKLFPVSDTLRKLQISYSMR